MRRFLTVLVAAIGLGMVLSGCVTNKFRTTYAPNSYVQKNYIDKTKIPKNKVAGDKNIKFYVDKIIDNRSKLNKEVLIKRTYGIPVGSVKFKNFQTTIRMTTEKALKRTGWGVVDNESRANFVVRAKINDLSTHMRLFDFNRVADAQICVLNDNKTVAKKHIYKNSGVLAVFDFTFKYFYIVGQVTEMYYKSLIDYFSSPNFVNAIKKAYFEMVTEGKN